MILLMFLFSALGLVLSGFLVANTLSAIIAEGVREIGVMKALGASRGQVMRLYLLTTLFYGLAGIILGLLVGSVSQWFLTLAVIALSTAAYLAAQSTSASVSQAVDGIFDI